MRIHKHRSPRFVPTRWTLCQPALKCCNYLLVYLLSNILLTSLRPTSLCLFESITLKGNRNSTHHFILNFTQQDMDLEQSQEPGSQILSNFCEQCSVVVFDDSADEFSEGTNWDNEPTLRHSREGGRIIILEHVRGWKDTLPDLPRMAESSRAGCSMCGFVREALLRRNVDYEGDVFVRGGYLWGGQGDAMDVSATDPGLAFWRCEVYKVARGTRENQVAVLNFGIETSNGKFIITLAPL